MHHREAIDLELTFRRSALNFGERLVGFCFVVKCSNNDIGFSHICPPGY